MSVLIKGMEMPMCCQECLFNNHAICMIATETPRPYVEFNKRRDNCPLVHVPDCGRLGDLDDVINDVRYYLCEGCGDYLGPDAKTESCDYCRGTMLIKTIERKSSIIQADKEG